MALKAIFQNMKKETGILKGLDNYLLSLSDKDSDRALDVNAPSSASSCIRASYYSRIGMEADGFVEPRLRRIFDNGSKVHDRLQEYLTKAGILLIPELPVIHEGLNIQGHSDGLVHWQQDRLAILEIKSINDNGFSKLVDATDDHKKQGMVYLFSTEERRVALRRKYKNKIAFRKSEGERISKYEQRYSYFKDGRRFTREEKIKMQVDLNMKADKILWECEFPIDTVVFWYENKNDQQIKEYLVKRDEEIISFLAEKYTILNKAVLSGKPPQREGKGKSDYICKNCKFKIECWI